MGAENADFCIKIAFEKGSESPTRVFRAMTGLIEAFQAIDKTLVQSIDVHIEPVLVLEDIETGSLRAWFRSLLEAIPDNGLANIDWKRTVGHYLVKGKHFLLDFTKDKGTITDRSELLKIQDRLRALAEETEVNRFLHCTGPEALDDQHATHHNSVVVFIRERFSKL